MFQLASVNKQFNKATETFKKSFNLTHRGDPVFVKTFDASSSDVIDIDDDTFIVNNHFFRTGEPLTYDATNGTAVGIQHGLNGVGAATTLPITVYAIEVGENKFKVASSPANAVSNLPIGLTTVGVGTTHRFIAEKQLSKCIVSLDSVIQAPLYETIGSQTECMNNVIGREIIFKDVGGFKKFDLIRINDEIMRIQIIGFGSSATNVLVDREWLGTSQFAHSIGDSIKLIRGDYNIIQDKIHFADVPFGGRRDEVGVSSETISVATDSFTVLTDLFESGTKVKLRTLDPPTPLEENREYFMIKNSANNFSFAEDRGDALLGNKINLTSAGIGTHKLLVSGTVEGSTFQGRVFTRSDYNDNVVLDDISDSFTGIAKTFTVKSAGVNTTGISTDFGAILINNIFQRPTTDYRLDGTPATGITTITFTGNESTTQTESYSSSDVNSNNLPRKGIITRIDEWEKGYGYQPRVVGVGSAVVSAAGTVSSIGFGFTGSGYRNNNETTYRFKVLGGGATTGAAGTFTTEVGHIKTIDITEPGVGYYHKSVSNAIHNINSGIMTVTTSANHNLEVGDRVVLSGIDMTDGSSTYSFPFPDEVGYQGARVVEIVPSVRKFSVNVGVHTVATSYSSGGVINKPTEVEFDSPIGYDDVALLSSLTGIGASVSIDATLLTQMKGWELTNVGYGYSEGEILTISSGINTDPTLIEKGFIDVASGDVYKIEHADYNANVGILTVAIGIHTLTVGMGVSLKDNSIGFTCAKDSYSTLHKYPRSTDPISGISTSIVGVAGTTVSINVGLPPVNERYDYKFAGSAFKASTFTVKHTMDDEFVGWVFGKLQVLDDFSNEFNGSKTVFTLREDSTAISFEKDIGNPIIIQNSLLIFIDDVLQEPGTSYVYNGGTQIEFLEPPKAGSSLQILFYRGTDSDVGTLTATPTLKTGDKVSIVNQDIRVVRDFISRDTIQTTLYKGPGISSARTPLRPLSWSKQRNDSFVDGVKVSKSRDDLLSFIFPSGRIIKDVGKTDTVLYIDTGVASFLYSEEPDASDITCKIIDTDKNNSGYGSTGFHYPLQNITGVSFVGDDGIISGVGTQNTKITFEFTLPLNSPYRENQYGGKTSTAIASGDYFIVSNSTVGSGLTAKDSAASAVVGVATEFLDGVYQVAATPSAVGSGQTMRVTCNIESGHGLNFTGFSSGVGQFYGNYSFCKLTSAAVGAAFTCNPLNGLTGIATAPQVIRSERLSLDYT